MCNQLQSFHAEVQEVHSGDDLMLLVDLGHDDLYKKVRARLQGVDTPDAYKSSADTEAGRIRDRVKKMIKGKTFCIQVHQMNPGKGGWIITLCMDGDTEGDTLNTILRDEGYVF